MQKAGITIHCRALDLGLEPTALLGQVDQLARAVDRLLLVHPPAAVGV